MITDYREMISDTLPVNRHALIDKLRELKIEKVDIHYNGCGDSGGTESIACTPVLKDGELENHQVDWQAPQHVKTKTGYQYLLVTNKVSLKEALEKIAIDWVSSLYGGWELDHGSFGDLEITVESGHVLLTHNEFELETYSHEHVM